MRDRNTAWWPCERNIHVRASRIRGGNHFERFRTRIAHRNVNEGWGYQLDQYEDPQCVRDLRLLRQPTNQDRQQCDPGRHGCVRKQTVNNGHGTPTVCEN